MKTRPGKLWIRLYQCGPHKKQHANHLRWRMHFLDLTVKTTFCLLIKHYWPLRFVFVKHADIKIRNGKSVLNNYYYCYMTTANNTHYKHWVLHNSGYSRNSTYKSMLVGDIVGKFKFVKVDDFGHPLLASGWAVGVNVHPLWHFGVSLTGHHPTRIMKFISTVVGRYNIHQQNIFGFFVQASASYFKGRKHSSARNGEKKKQISLKSLTITGTYWLWGDCNLAKSAYISSLSGVILQKHQQIILVFYFGLDAWVP